MQGQGQGGPQYKGVFDVVKHLYREGGVRSVFRGSAATVARDGPGSAAYVVCVLMSALYPDRGFADILQRTR